MAGSSKLVNRVPLSTYRLQLGSDLTLDAVYDLLPYLEKLGISDLGRKAIGVAAMNRRAAELPGIASAYRALVARERGARQVEIISARPLAEGEKSAIVDALGKQLGAKVEAETRVDDSLIGGFVVRVGSRQFDASVKAKLDALRLALKSA